jgi:hypothetical protein
VGPESLGEQAEGKKRLGNSKYASQSKVSFHYWYSHFHICMNSFKLYFAEKLITMHLEASYRITVIAAAAAAAVVVVVVVVVVIVLIVVSTDLRVHFVRVSVRKIS